MQIRHCLHTFICLTTVYQLHVKIYFFFFRKKLGQLLNLFSLTRDLWFLLSLNQLSLSIKWISPSAQIYSSVVPPCRYIVVSIAFIGSILTSHATQLHHSRVCESLYTPFSLDPLLSSIHQTPHKVFGILNRVVGGAMSDSEHTDKDSEHSGPSMILLVEPTSIRHRTNSSFRQSQFMIHNFYKEKVQPQTL